MCGIFGYVGKQADLGKMCFDALRQLEYRGYDSWGIAVSGHELEIKKEVGKLPQRALSFHPGRMVLGHSRWATHGGVTVENAHPHVSSNEQAIVVHNGIVENYLDLKDILLKNNCSLKSETDTEVIVQLYEQSRADLEPLAAFISTISQLKGNNAIVIMDLKAGMLLATKNGSPMVIGRSTDGNYIASDISPLLNQCESIYYVENNEILVVDTDSFLIYDAEVLEFSQPVWQKPEISLAQVELGSFDHYLVKEVSEQPEILRKIALKESDELTEMRAFIKSGSEVWFTGCGTAFYAGLLATYFAAKTGHTARAVYAHELPMLLGQIHKSSRVVALSQSGETIDVIDAISVAKVKNIATGALVNVPTSSLSRLVDCVLPIQAGPEICVLSTKAFTAMVASLFALYSPQESYRSSLLAAAKAIEKMLSKNALEQIDMIAEKICQKQSVFIIGTGQYYPLALEAALKIKEVSYIHAEAFPSGELKHGVIALIEEGTPCLVFAPDEEMPNDVAAERIKIHASEIRARGGNIISISPELLAPEDDIIKADFNGIAYFFAALTAVQMLAYKCALIKNLDPDKPRNLAKSVTVR